MKNSIYIYILSVLFLNSCTKDFEKLNTNPNSPTEVHPSLLLRQVIYNYGDEMAYEGFVAGNLLGQHFAQIDFNLFDRHSLSEPQWGGNPWTVIYKNLRDNEIILQQSKENLVYKVYEGPALILKAYMTAALTDIYGDIPYSEAISGISGKVNPKYDSQEEIYIGTNGILDNLNKGIQAIENYNGAQKLEGDILYNGNLSSWILFANSLKIKFLMRISDKINVSNELQVIYNSTNFINSNSENAAFYFSSSQPNNFRMAKLREGDFTVFVMSKTMEEILKKFNDPRISVLYRPFGNDTTGNGFNGLLNGQDASTNSFSLANYSLSGTIFRENTGSLQANFMTAWETHFLLAEASQRGFINANTQQLYETGVQEAFEYWNTSIPSSYLTSDSAGFGNYGANPLEQIITQKWISNSINGYEGWIEYRRTGFPNLKTLAASLNGNLIPSRMPYPADEQALNSINYNLAISSNGNSINAKVWWDN